MAGAAASLKDLAQQLRDDDPDLPVLKALEPIVAGGLEQAGRVARGHRVNRLELLAQQFREDEQQLAILQSLVARGCRQERIG